MPAKTMQRIKGLDSIRFFLAFIVLLSHLPNPYIAVLKNSGSPIAKVIGIIINHLVCGTGAVIAFFVISGYVIHVTSIRNQTFQVPRFLIRRWLRVGIPLLIIALIANKYGILLSMPIWSLFCEIIYYTLYPLLIKLPGNWKIKFSASFVLAFIIIIIFNRQNIASMLHQKNINYHGTYACNGIYITWLIGIPCWLLGVVLAEKLRNLDGSKPVTVTKMVLWRCIIFASGMVVFSLKAHFFVSYVLSLNFFALICYYWLRNEIIYYHTHQPMALFEQWGMFSYSLFICHKLIFYLLEPYLPLNTGTYFVYISIAFAISYVFYICIEYPAHQLAKFAGKYKN